jgi:hypothetical protein
MLFKVLTVVAIDIAVWFRTPCCLVHGYECCGGAFLVCLHRQSEDVCSDQNLGTHQSDYMVP